MILIVADVTYNKCNKQIFIIMAVAVIVVVAEHSKYDSILAVPIFVIWNFWSKKSGVGKSYIFRWVSLGLFITGME